MTFEHDETTAPADPRTQAVLRTAAEQLRAHVDERWVEVADEILSHALTSSRPSWPVRAHASSGPILVAEQVLVAYLRASIDRIPDCEVVSIRVETEGAECTGVVVALAARYSVPLIALADRVRDVAHDELARLLGSAAPTVTVSTMHVHVSDVTRGDPKL